MLSRIRKDVSRLFRKEVATGTGAATTGTPKAAASTTPEDIPGLHRLFPNDPTLVALQAMELGRRGAVDRALVLLDDVEQHSGVCEDTRFARAELLVAKGDRVNAIEVLMRGGELRARRTLMLLAENLYLTGRCAEAEVAYSGALEFAPRCPAALLSRGAAKARMGRLEEAAMDTHRALRFDPRSREAHGNLCWIQGLRNDFEAEERAIEEGLAFFPGNAELLVARGIARLLRGDFARGWDDFDARLRDPKTYPVRRSLLAKPLWSGGAFPGKRLLVFGEQGAGDHVMMARYLPAVKVLGGTVVYEGPAHLHELIESAGGVDECIDLNLERAPEADVDMWVPIMSLARLLDGPRGPSPARIPYLSVPEHARNFWHDLLGERDRPRVGLAWSGNPKHVNDAFRSLPAAELGPLLEVRGLAFFSLQLGARGTEMTRVHDLTEHLITFTDTAALIDQMDLVICVDTSVAHVAGALGKETWLMLPHRPDWRWLLERADSPWYPTLRLFRQAKTLDWESVTRAVAAALLEWRVRRVSAAHREKVEA